MLPPKVISVPTPPPAEEAEEVVRARAMAESMYEATDAVRTVSIRAPPLQHGCLS